MNDKGYIKSLDGVRALAIIMVMTFHAQLTRFGWMGVQVFFVLSGFLITGILWKEKFMPASLSYKLKKFWLRRTLRIFPLYFGYLVFLGITYVIFHVPSSYTLYLPYLATYTFNYMRSTPGWHGNALFTHLWSLSIEEQFYLIFPLIIYLCSPRIIKYFMITVIFAEPLIRFFLDKYYQSKGLTPFAVADAVYWNTFSHLDAFFLGGIIPVLSLESRLKNPYRVFIAAVLIVVVPRILNLIYKSSAAYYFNDVGHLNGNAGNLEHIWHYAYYTCLNFLFSSFLLLLVSKNTHKRFVHLQKLFEYKWLVNIGKVSYGMYIFHWIILSFFYDHFLQNEPLLLKKLFFIPYTIVVYLFARLVYVVYEERFIKMKNRFFKPNKESLSTIT